MGAKLKGNSSTFEKAPGAGTYNLPSKVIESPGKSFSKKLFDNNF